MNLTETPRSNRIVLCVKAALAEPKLVDEYITLVSKRTGIPQYSVTLVELEKTLEVLSMSTVFWPKIRAMGIGSKFKAAAVPKKSRRKLDDSSSSSSSSDSSSSSESDKGGMDLGFSEDEAHQAPEPARRKKVVEKKLKPVSKDEESDSSESSSSSENGGDKKNSMKKKLAGLAARRRAEMRLKPKPPPPQVESPSNESRKLEVITTENVRVEEVGNRCSDESPKVQNDVDVGGPDKPASMPKDVHRGGPDNPASIPKDVDKSGPDKPASMPKDVDKSGPDKPASMPQDVDKSCYENVPREGARKMRQPYAYRADENIRPDNTSSAEPASKKVRVAEEESPASPKTADWSSDFGRLIRQAIDNKRVCPFRTLGLAPASSMAEVKKRWAKLCLLLHPDKAPAEWKSVPELVDANQAVNEAKRSIEQRFQAIALSRPQKPGVHPQPYTLDKGTFGKRRVEVRWMPSPIGSSREKVERYLVFIMHGQDPRRRDQMLSAGSVKEGTDPFFVVVEDDQRFARFFASSQLTISILASNAAGNSDPHTILVPLR